MHLKDLVRKASATMVVGMLAVAAFAQGRTVTGVVTDEFGEPLPGVNVVVKGTTNGVITDVDGNFEIRVAPGTTLEVSCIGYITRRVAAANNMTITLEDDTEMLEETVVIGYGVQRKSDLTGAVASVREDDLKNRSTSDAAAALQGKMAGVQIISNSGAPGSGAAIQVRGVSSNSGNIGPLIIVDGLKVSSIQYLDPSLIESMEDRTIGLYGAFDQE